MPDFGLLQMPNFAQAALGGYQAGVGIGTARRREAVLGKLASSPDDPALTGQLASVDPDAARQYVALRSTIRTADRDNQFRVAASDYQRARGPNTLGSLLRRQNAPQPGGAALTGGVQPDAPAQAVLAGNGSVVDPRIPGSGAPAPADAAPYPAALPAAPIGAPSQGTAELPATAAVESAQAPAGNADAAYQRMADIDPERALALRAQLSKANAEDLDAYQKVNAASLQLMGGVHDQASYDEAKRRAHELHDQYGVGPDSLQLPDQYDPKVVQGLMMSAMNMSQQLAAVRAQTRLDWDIQDDKIDNERADKNTNSLIEDRNGRRGLIARGQNMTDRRGRDATAIASSDRQRGQDMQDRRYRDGVQGGPRRSSAAASSGGGKITKVATGPGGKKVGWNGSSWVPVQ
ncbi:hypothetical protein D9601_19400 [Sphingomonas sp. MA1305]|uniref:hypothetical protein n=1 Tax=Sphingomonas sp. MA1305 TaxID=2479204 RepID=UPI0018DF3513|nr:hypothetical protein [Sphingomonas sp. MA1305]MBI0477505.1 hypothetical protein [Sphingomonas sp. MA1305]